MAPRSLSMENSLWSFITRAMSAAWKGSPARPFGGECEQRVGERGGLLVVLFLREEEGLEVEFAAGRDERHVRRRSRTRRHHVLNRVRGGDVGAWPSAGLPSMIV